MIQHHYTEKGRGDRQVSAVSPSERRRRRRRRADGHNGLLLGATQHQRGGELTHRPQIKQLPACSRGETDPQLGVHAGR